MMQMYGPFTLKLEVGVTDGVNDGVVTYGFGAGQIPTYDEVMAAVEEAKDQVTPMDYRLPTKEEYCNALIREKTGSTERFAIPGSQDWDVPER